MHFSAPQALWLLWILPPLAALYVLSARRRRVAMRRFADETMIDRLVPPASRGRTWLRGGMLGAALLGVLLAAAGPRWGFSWEEVQRRGVDVVVTLDLSRSMLAEDAKPNRLVAAKREITDLLELLQGDRVGLVAFAGSAYVQCPLTLDYGAFSLFLDPMDPDWVPIGGTDLAEAVRVSTKTFQDSERSGRAVILITDGEDHSGELQKAAEEARKEGVHVFVVGMGAPEGAPIPDGRGGFIKEDGKVVLSKLDEVALKELALTTGGTYVRSVAGDLDLRRIYTQDIKGTLEARDLSSSRQRRWEERFQWALLPALLLLVLESLSGTRRRRTDRPGAAAALLVAGLAFAVPSSAAAGWFTSDDPTRLGHAAFSDGDHQAALDHWIAAQVADPGDRRLDYNIGQAHYRLGAFAEAEDAFREAAATDDTALAADALYNAGNAAFQQGKYPDAMAAYDEALEVRPEDEDTLSNRDLAQRKYEELLDEAANQEQNPDQEQEPQDGQADEQDQEPQDGEGEPSDDQEQQQGEGKSEQQQESDEPKPGEGEQEQDATAENEDESGEPEKKTEEQSGGVAEAADIDRSGEDADEAETKEGAVAEETDWDESQNGEPREPVEGALSEEQAKALLDALKADQSNRRRERTEREAKRGRRGAAKDW